MNNIIFVYFKNLRGNCFLFISDYSGKLLFSTSCGNIGFKGIKKRTNDAILSLIYVGVQFLLNLKKTKKIFLKIEGGKKEFLSQINIHFVSVLKSYNINFFVFKLINKISHNGCKKFLKKRF